MRTFTLIFVTIFLLNVNAFAAPILIPTKPLSVKLSTTKDQARETIEQNENWIKRIKKKISSVKISKFIWLLFAWLLSTGVSAGFFWRMYLSLFTGGPVWPLALAIIFAIISIVCFVFLTIEIVNS